MDTNNKVSSSVEENNEVTPEQFLLNIPLYSDIDISNISPLTVLEYLFYTGSLECYCPQCKKHSIFNDNHSVGQRQNSSTFDKTVWIKNIYYYKFEFLF